MGWEYKEIIGTCEKEYKPLTLTNGSKYKFTPHGTVGTHSGMTSVIGGYLGYTGECYSTAGPFGYDVRYVDGDNISNVLKFRQPTKSEPEKTNYTLRIYPSIQEDNQGNKRTFYTRCFLIDNSGNYGDSVRTDRQVVVGLKKFKTSTGDEYEFYPTNSSRADDLKTTLYSNSSGDVLSKYSYQYDINGDVVDLVLDIDYDVYACDNVRYSYVVVTGTTFEHDTGQEKNAYACKIYHLNFGGLTRDLERINFDLRCGYMKMGYNETTFKDTNGINPFNTSVNQDGYHNSPNWTISLNVDNTYGAVLYSPTTSVKCGNGTNLSDNLKAAGNNMFSSALYSGITLSDIFGDNAENVKRCTNFVLTVSCNDSNDETDGNFSGECSSSVTYVNNEANMPYGDDFWFDIGTDPTQSFENIEVSDTETHITYYGKLESASTNIYPRLNLCQTNGAMPCFYEIPYELDTTRARLMSQQSEGDPETFKSFNTTNELISARFYNFSLQISRNGYISINVEGWADPYEITERSIEIEVPVLYRGEIAIPNYRIIFNWWDVSGN